MKAALSQIALETQVNLIPPSSTASCEQFFPQDVSCRMKDPLNLMS